MKLQQLQEARYTGEHPIVKQIKASIANREFGFHVQIKDKKKAEDAERGIIAAFGPPDEQGPTTEDEYRYMLWNFTDNIQTDLQLQIVDDLPANKKKVMTRAFHFKGQFPDYDIKPTMMDIALI